MSNNYRTTLKSSPNESITHLWKLTKNHTNIQYDQYSATKEVIKSFRDNQENKLTNQLTPQGSLFTSITRYGQLVNPSFLKTFLTSPYVI